MGDENNQGKTADKPHPDQLRFWSVQEQYWADDLELKKRAFNVAKNARCISLLALAVSFLGFLAVWISLQNNVLALKNNVRQSMTTLTMDLDKMEIEHPELSAYFNSNSYPTSTTNYALAAEVAIMKLDVFDLAFAQATVFKKQWSFPEGWTNWVADDFRNSPFLRQQYHQVAGWYGSDMSNMVDQIEASTNRIDFPPTNSTP